MDNNSDPRHQARVMALQKLFERHFVCDDITKGYSEEYDLEELKEINEEDFDEGLFNKLFTGTQEYHELADEVIKSLAPQWPLEMINKVDLQVLRMSIFEGFIEKLTPVKVVLNEAIELGKEFGGMPSGKFINGVLGNLVENKKMLKLLENAKDNK